MGFFQSYIYIYAVECNWLNTHVIYDWYKINIYDIPTLSFPRGLPFIAMGYIMATSEVSNSAYNLSKHFIKQIIPILLIVFIFVSGYTNNQLISQFLTLMAVPLIIICFKRLELPSSPVWKGLRDCSILFYLLHFMIIVYLRQIPILCQFEGLTKYLAVLCIAGIISYLIIKLSRMHKTNVFKYLY